MPASVITEMMFAGMLRLSERAYAQAEEHFRVTRATSRTQAVARGRELMLF